MPSPIAAIVGVASRVLAGKVGQTAALIEKACRIRRRDRRIFKDHKKSRVS